MSTPKAIWSAEEAIDIGASLAYLGDQADATLFGSGSGVLGFSVEELTGDKEMGAAWHDDCKGYTIGTHQPISAAYRKSGGWGEEDPNAAFYKAFFADPLFHLPRGQWKITALAMFSFGNVCGQGRKVDLRASVTITVQ